MANRPDSSGGGSGTDTTVPPASAYRNPLRGVRGLTAERIDMGVDYSGEGPVYALGPGVITAAGNAWAGAVGAPYPGTWITEKVTEGPLAGQSVYVAEDIYDVQVKPGQHVDSSTVLGTLRGGMETGFAARGAGGAGGTTAAAAAGQQASGGDPGGVSTAYGKAYSAVLSKTGAPAGVSQGATSGLIPGWLGKAIGVLFPWVSAGQAAAGAAGAASGVSGVLSWLQQLDTAITWLLNPSNWIRIICGVTGGVMVIGGVFVLSGVQAKVSAEVPVIGGAGSQVQSGTRLPVGILLVGAGGVLLFIAFHNLPPGLSFSEFVGYEQGQVQGAAVTAATGKATP